MSEIIAFRDRVIEVIKEKITDLREVDWYDGLFDEEDVKEWVVNAPAAYVSVVSIPRNDHHTTGEMNASLRFVVTVVTEDRFSARDNDGQNWALIEKIADLVNLNAFAYPNAAPATAPVIKRLRDPELRREGIALGVIEWDSGLTFGTNRTHQHEYIYDPVTGRRVMALPTENQFLGVARAGHPPNQGTVTESLRRADKSSAWFDEP